MEAIGDITASAEVSRVDVDGEDFESRIQGGVLVSLNIMADQPTAELPSAIRVTGLAGLFPRSSL